MRNCVGVTGRWVALGVMLASVGCGGSDGPSNETETMSGGAPGTGGTGTTGGTASGGMSSTGGMTAAGGSDSGGSDSGGSDSGGSDSGGSDSGGSDSGGSETGGKGGEKTDDFDSGNDARNDVSAGDVCDRLATLQCAGEQKCCDEPGRDFDACKAQVVESCKTDTYLDTISANPATGFDETLARAAMLEFETRAKACDVTVASWGESVAGLRGIMQGTRDEGESCVGPASGATKADAAAALASCLDPENVSCLIQFFPPSAICKPRGGVGSNCITDINCELGMYCPQNDYLNPLPSKCAARLELDTSCKSNNECTSLACKSGKCVEATKNSAYCLN